MQRLLRGDDWWANPLFWIEGLLIFNLAFLAVDIALAHAANAFEHRAEWIPIAFSVAATFLLLVGMILGGVLPVVRGGADGARPRQRIARALGIFLGLSSIVVGVAGLLWHLNADFFQERTLRNLIYTAPFAAPLAYSGLGLLLILDRMVDARTQEWFRWVLLLAAGGFAGNFVLSLADHAQNGFFHPTEWIGVVGAAIAFGFLLAGVIAPGSLPILVMNLAIMGIQMVIAVLGFYLHAMGNLERQSESLWDRFIYGAPVFAPLLFADIALLALLGLWAQARFLTQPESTKGLS